MLREFPFVLEPALEEEVLERHHYHRYGENYSAVGRQGHDRAAPYSLVVEVDVSVEHDLAVNILDDVVAVEPIAVLIKIVGTLCTRVALHAQDCLADLLRIQALGVVDGERKQVNRVVGPRSEEVGRRLVGLLVF